MAAARSSGGFAISYVYFRFLWMTPSLPIPVLGQTMRRKYIDRLLKVNNQRQHGLDIAVYIVREGATQIDSGTDGQQRIRGVV